MDGASFCLIASDCDMNVDTIAPSVGESGSIERHQVLDIEDIEEGWRREGEFTRVRVRVELVVAGELREVRELADLEVFVLHVVGACFWVEATVSLGHKFGASHHREVLPPSEGIEAALPDTLQVVC